MNRKAIAGIALATALAGPVRCCRNVGIGRSSIE